MSALPFTLRQLEVFSSLCAMRSFRRSAESLGISQASVSNQMKALEAQLGVELFARRPGQRPTLTVEGMAFLNDLRAFQAASETLAGHRRRGEEEGLVRYRVLVGLRLLDGYIRPKLSRFFAAHPGIELNFEPQTPRKDLIRDLKDGRHDFALFHHRADRGTEPHVRELALVRGGVYGHRKFAEGCRWRPNSSTRCRSSCRQRGARRRKRSCALSNAIVSALAEWSATPSITM